MLELAWPEGLQEGYSQPVALLLDESPETEKVVTEAGYSCFSDLGAFLDYVQREILAVPVEIV